MRMISLKYYRALCFLLVVCCPWLSSAQNSIWNNSQNLSGKAGKKAGKATGKLKQWKNHLQQWGLDSDYKHTLSLSGKLLTNGWSVGLVYGRPSGTERERRRGKHAGQSVLWSLHFSEIKHEKQVKQQKENSTHPEWGAALPFVFGKINNLYLLQIGLGREQLLLPGVLDGNISASFRYGGGLSLGMLKPYYLNLMYVDYVPDMVITIKEERYNAENADIFLARDKISGGSRWTTGLDEIQYVPGLFIEGAFVLETAKSKGFVQKVILGGQFSVYTKDLPIMADRKAYPYIGSLYVGLELGKRWK